MTQKSPEKIQSLVVLANNRSFIYLDVNGEICVFEGDGNSDNSPKSLTIGDYTYTINPHGNSGSFSVTYV
jgi:hypothetical protein